MAAAHVAHGVHATLETGESTVHSSNAMAHIRGALATDHVGVFAMHHVRVVCMHGCVA